MCFLCHLIEVVLLLSPLPSEETEALVKGPSCRLVWGLDSPAPDTNLCPTLSSSFSLPHFLVCSHCCADMHTLSLGWPGLWDLCSLLFSAAVNVPPQHRPRGGWRRGVWCRASEIVQGLCSSSRFRQVGPGAFRHFLMLNCHSYRV